MTNPVLVGSRDASHATILLVHADDLEREVLGYLLQEEGFRVCAASAHGEALDMFQANPEALVLFNSTQEMTGLDFLPSLRAINPAARCCLIGPDDARFTHCFPKPLPLLDMIPVLRQLADNPARG